MTAGLHNGPEEETVLLHKLLSPQDTVYFTNLAALKSYSGTPKVDIDSLIRTLNNLNDENIKTVVVDEKYDITTGYLWERLIMPDIDSKIYLYTRSPKVENASLLCNDIARKKLIVGLSGQIAGFSYGSHHVAARRSAILTIEGYADLSITRVPYGVGFSRNANNSAVLAPFDSTQVQAKEQENMTKDRFVEFVIGSPMFTKVVEYVLKYSFKKESLTSAIITSSYRKLIAEYYDVMLEIQQNEVAE